MIGVATIVVDCDNCEHGDICDHIIPWFTLWSFKNGCAELFEMQVDEKWPSINSLFACFSNAVVTWPCDVIAVSHLLDFFVKYFIWQSKSSRAKCFKFSAKTWIWMLYTQIYNKYCIGATFDLQDIRKQWPILCLLPMCRIDAGISIMFMTRFMFSGIYHYLEMSQSANIPNLNSHLVNDYIDSKKTQHWKVIFETRTSP